MTGKLVNPMRLSATVTAHQYITTPGVTVSPPAGDWAVLDMSGKANYFTGPVVLAGGDPTDDDHAVARGWVNSAIGAAVTGLWDLKGDIDCSANPDYPAASKSDAYAVTVAGKVGGASGASVDIGDVVVAKADNAGGTQAAVGASWMIFEHNRPTRTITGTADEIAVVNGDGASGDPTISLPASITLTGKTVTGGTFVTPSLTGPLTSSNTSGVAVTLESDGIGTVMYLRTFANSGGGPLIAGIRARGTLAVPVIVNTNDPIFTLRAFAYAGSATYRAVFDMVTTVIEPTPSLSALGARWVLSLAPLGSASPVEALRFDHATGLTVAGSVNATNIAKNNFAGTAAPTSTDDAAAGYAAGSMWLWVAAGRAWRCRDATANAAAWIELGASEHPGYISGNWYHAHTGGVEAGGPLSTGIYVFAPFTLRSRVTLAQLGLRITTLAAGGNVQVAIYANNPATGRPTGPVLAASGNLSTAAAASVGGAIVGGNVTLEPGHYWMAVAADGTASGTVAYQAPAAATHPTVSLIGSATQANLSAAATSKMMRIHTATGFAFNTWPNMTGATWVETAGGQGGVAMHFKVA